MMSTVAPNSAKLMHPFALMKCMGSDLDRAALGLCSGLTVVAGFL